MANVYLPYGYPQLQGMQFENVIYQGTMCRLYQDVTDPRTNAQLQQRRINSDLAKMRATLGDFGKAAANKAMGSQWTTAFFQAIKADIDGWWSDAIDAWEGMADVGKNAWRSEAPYTATFNDAGLVFWAINQVLPRALNHFGGMMFDTQLWTDGQSSECRTWWDRSLVGIRNASFPVEAQTTGTWTFYQGYAISNDVAGTRAWVWYYSSKANVFISGSTPPALVRLSMDGVQLWEQYVGVISNPFPVALPRTGLYLFEVEKRDNSYVNFGGIVKSYQSG
jgi:hypothetical protein